MIKGIVLDADGYISRQKDQRIMYGKFNSSYNGCGWIAVYNWMRNFCLDQQECYEMAQTVIDLMSLDLWFGGVFGTFPWQIKSALKDFRIPVSVSLRKAGDKVGFKEHGILYYFNGKMFHYVYFKKRFGPEKYGYTIYNIGGKVYVDSIDDFIATCSTFKHYLLIQ